ncbi:MAG: CCA tRNA nucleotidyltransferase, partial [Fibrobacterales bacterium]|nr:CCA tRNA nucleotidyltransferase [Fibrobacterales bacterium]
GDDASEAPARLRALAVEAGVSEAPPKPWLQGRDLSALGMKPGPKMGEILREAFEKQLDEEFSSPEEAFVWVKKTAF